MIGSFGLCLLRVPTRRGVDVYGTMSLSEIIDHSNLEEVSCDSGSYYCDAALQIENLLHFDAHSTLSNGRFFNEIRTRFTRHGSPRNVCGDIAGGRSGGDRPAAMHHYQRCEVLCAVRRLR